MSVLYKIFIPFLLFHSVAFSQGEQLVFNRNGFVSIVPAYQHWNLSDTTGFSQSAVSLGVFVPLGREWSVSLRTTAAGVSGDIPSLGGPGDTQLGVSYNLSEHNVVINASANLPSGKEKLTTDEFQTSIIVSKSIFDLHVPNYGQGAGVTVGGIWGIQLSEKVVVGVGASYAYMGSYTPLEQYDEPYDPGDELLLSGGVEFQASKSLEVSCDVVFTTYGRDKLEDKEIFAAGNKVTAFVQLASHFGEDELRLFALYRSRAKSQYAVGESFLTEPNRFMPNQFELRAHYEHRINPTMSGRVILTGTFSDETADRFSGAAVVGVGLGGGIGIGKGVTISPAAEYRLGSFKDDGELTGVLGAVGVSWEF